MTTVAYHGGVMAADSLMSCGNQISYGVMKVGRTDSYLFGYAGPLGSLSSMYYWIEKLDKEGVHPRDFWKRADDLVKMNGNGEALIADQSGNLWSISADGQAIHIPDGYDAVGSGREYALGAILAGSTAARAVRIACAIDAFTGGNVECITFADPVQAPRNKGEIIHESV